MQILVVGGYVVLEEKQTLLAMREGSKLPIEEAKDGRISVLLTVFLLQNWSSVLQGTASFCS